MVFLHRHNLDERNHYRHSRWRRPQSISRCAAGDEESIHVPMRAGTAGRHSAH